MLKVTRTENKFENPASSLLSRVRHALLQNVTLGVLGSVRAPSAEWKARGVARQVERAVIFPPGVLFAALNGERPTALNASEYKFPRTELQRGAHGFWIAGEFN